MCGRDFSFLLFFFYASVLHCPFTHDWMKPGAEILHLHLMFKVYVMFGLFSRGNCRQTHIKSTKHVWNTVHTHWVRQCHVGQYVHWLGQHTTNPPSQTNLPSCSLPPLDPSLTMWGINNIKDVRYPLSRNTYPLDLLHLLEDNVSDMLFKVLFISTEITKIYRFDAVKQKYYHLNLFYAGLCILHLQF